MAQWYVKDLSKLTKVSVQTLHHYDRIDLLKPSIRLPNGYRLYSEKDLLRLQQIIALKYFGFELAQIKNLLAGRVDVVDHFAVQSQFLEEKAKTLNEASQTLKSILSDCHRDKSIPWETIIKLIEVYRMTQELEKGWAGKVLSPDELQQYVNFAKELQTRFTPTEKQAYEKEWANLTKEIEANLDKDPSSKIGIEIGKRCMTWVNTIYPKKHASLRKTIWEKGFIEGHAGQEHGISAVGVAWLDKAIYAFHRERVISILSKLETHNQNEVLQLWNDMLEDMYGDNQSPKNELVEVVLKIDDINQNAKDWLRKISKI